jgi:heptosyltransferase-1
MQRVLIIRTSAIGDVVFASPFAYALKQTYPTAKLAWLVEPGIHDLLAGDPTIDELIIWPRAEWVGLWREGRYRELWQRVSRFRRELHARQFDLAIDLQGLLKSGLLTWMSGAKRRIGLGSREGSQWLMTETVSRRLPSTRMGPEYLRLAEYLGLETGRFLPRLCISATVTASVDELLAERGLNSTPYAVLAPFTTRPQKHWFEAAWIELARRLRNELGVTPVILGGPGDRAAAKRIAIAAPGSVALAGATRLPEAAALIRRASLLVGVDTGLTHMGAAFGTPTVALFGSTCPYLDGGRSNFQVIWLGLPCSPCRRKPTCHGQFTCLRDITPERVLNEARTVLAEGYLP